MVDDAKCIGFTRQMSRESFTQQFTATGTVAQGRGRVLLTRRPRSTCRIDLKISQVKTKKLVIVNNVIQPDLTAIDRFGAAG